MTTNLDIYKQEQINNLSNQYVIEKEVLKNNYMKMRYDILHDRYCTLVITNKKLEELLKNYNNSMNKLNEKYKILQIKITNITEIPLQSTYSTYVTIPSTKINKPSNKKALLVGINYNNSQYELNGCINDVMLMKEKLIKRGYKENNIILLTDYDVSSSILPTKETILNELTIILKSSKPGDLIFFHFSGHGSYVLDKNKDEIDGCDEMIVTCDFKGIVDDELNKIITTNLNREAIFVGLFDSCFSGSILDLKYTYYDSTQNNKLVVNNTYNNTNANIISISGCQDNQTSADACFNGTYEGALTQSFLSCLNDKENQTWKEILQNVRSKLKSSGFTQIPQLSSGKYIDINTNLIL